jgi:type II secretory pathway pseudopilin PulG
MIMKPSKVKYVKRNSLLLHQLDQAGLSMIELLLVVTIVIVLGAAMFVIYPRVENARDAARSVQTVNLARAEIKALFQSNNYRKVSTTLATDSKIFPKDMIFGSANIRNQWDGAVLVTPSLSNGDEDAGTDIARYFRIVYNDVPSAVCIKLAAGLAESYGAIQVGGVVVKNLYATVPVPLNEADIAHYCRESEAAGATEGSSQIIVVSN